MPGTPLQAMKFAVRLSNDTCASFLTRFMAGEDMSAWGIALDKLVDTSRSMPSRMSFPEFCVANPDEPERVAEDGTVRKAYYGDGRQPWDDMIDFGWAVEFAAGNVLKYLRRTKDLVASVVKAKWYLARLIEFVNDDTDTARMNDAKRVAIRLFKALTREEIDQLGVPSCFRPINA